MQRWSNSPVVARETRYQDLHSLIRAMESSLRVVYFNWQTPGSSKRSAEPVFAGAQRR